MQMQIQVKISLEFQLSLSSFLTTKKRRSIPSWKGSVEVKKSSFILGLNQLVKEKEKNPPDLNEIGTKKKKKNKQTGRHNSKEMSRL